MIKLFVPWLVIGLVACGTKTNPDLCCVSAEDCASVGLSGSEKTCADGLVCSHNTCTNAQCATDSDCSGATPHCGADHTCVACVDSSQCGGGTPVCTPDNVCVGCIGSSDCGGTTPVCSPDMTCVGCLDSSSCGGSTPVCAPDNTCVQCLDSTQCSGATPLCDPQSHACVGCVMDSDCPSQVCNDGACIDEAKLVYASPSGTTSATCAKTDPCSFAKAFGLAAGNAARNAVALAPGGYTSPAQTLSGAKTVRLYGAAATLSCPFTVQDGATLEIRHLTFDPGTDLFCAPSTAGGPMPSVDVDQADWPDIQTSSLSAIYGQPCSIRLTRSRIHVSSTLYQALTASGEAVATGAPANRGSTVAIDRSTIDGGGTIAIQDYSAVTITNSVVENQDPTRGTFNIMPPTGAISVSFTTFFNTQIKAPTVSSTCGFSNNIIDDQHVGAPADTITGTFCTYTNNLIRPQSTQVGTGNVLNVDPKFVDPTNADYHLKMGSPAIDAASSGANDPDDFDGTPRPQGAGYDLGAFEYH